MFTGIIEELGKIRSIKRNGTGALLEVNAKIVLNGTSKGDSIAVNGVCLTVKECNRDSFCAELLAETLSRSNLGILKCRDLVNLERAATTQGRLGGHIVTGHIDGTGVVKQISRIKGDKVFEIGCGKELIKQIVVKGSIAVDGISLTVVNVGPSSFTVHLISHTLENTNLAHKNINDIINIETDIIGKYVKNFVSKKDSSAITERMLKEEGYL